MPSWIHLLGSVVPVWFANPFASVSRHPSDLVIQTGIDGLARALSKVNANNIYRC